MDALKAYALLAGGARHELLLSVGVVDVPRGGGSLWVSRALEPLNAAASLDRTAGAGAGFGNVLLACAGGEAEAAATATPLNTTARVVAALTSALKQARECVTSCAAGGLVTVVAFALPASTAALASAVFAAARAGFRVELLLPSLDDGDNAMLEAALEAGAAALARSLVRLLPAGSTDDAAAATSRVAAAFSVVRVPHALPRAYERVTASWLAMSSASRLMELHVAGSRVGAGAGLEWGSLHLCSCSCARVWAHWTARRAPVCCVEARGWACSRRSLWCRSRASRSGASLVALSWQSRQTRGLALEQPMRC